MARGEEMTKSRSRVALLLLCVLLSCKKEEKVAYSAEAQDVSGAQRSAAMQSDGATASTATAANAPTPGVSSPQPKIIRNVRIELAVRNVADAAALLEANVEKFGGYSATSRRWSDGETTRANLTFRVPSARLSEFLKSVRATATHVRNEELSGEDVTQEYVDLGAQLKNLEATEVELRQLVSSVRARSQKASEVLEVYREMVSIRGEIEKARGRLQYLEQMTSYATVSVDLIPDAVAQAPVKSGWQPLGEIVEATRALSGTLQWLANVAIWFVIYVAPLLLLFGLGIYGFGRMVQAFRHRTAAVALDGSVK